MPGTQADSSGWGVRLYGLSSGDGTMAVALPPQSVTSSVERVTPIVVTTGPASYTHLRAHETVLESVCRLLLEKKKKNKKT